MGKKTHTPEKQALPFQAGYTVCVKRPLDGPSAGRAVVSYLPPCIARKGCGNAPHEYFTCEWEDIPAILGFLQLNAKVSFRCTMRIMAMRGGLAHVHYTSHEDTGIRLYLNRTFEMS